MNRDMELPTAILFIVMMVAVSYILLQNALSRLSVVIQDIPTDYTKLFAESEIIHIRHGIWLLLFFGLVGWGFYILTKIEKHWHLRNP
ncbi:MAG: hypothetical protein WBA22_04855 [Candidatus Methanofastidiosia archaeon]